MAETKKGFDLAGLMKNVSNLNTQTMQIEYLPYDLIDPDPDNFYRLEGLNELADSIATVGLVHPLLVRPSGERYTVTSGHRRRAAIKLLIDGGDTQWQDAVPCIVDHGETTPEFTELKLIFANNQRQKTSAELSKEAERVEQLLVALKEKGFEFPGRMQDHVAQAMNVHTSKLKRLHAIRSNLAPEMLALFDSGEVNEACAYELQKLPAGVQRCLAQQKNIGQKLRASGLQEVQLRLDALMHPSCKCPDGEACRHTYPRVKQTAMNYLPCPGGCCLKCHRGASECPYRCKQSKDALIAEKEDRKASEERAKAEQAKILEENRDILTGKYIALDVLAREKKLPDDTHVSIPGCQTIADLHDRANGKGSNDYKAQDKDVFGAYSYVKYVKDTADLLGVSVDFLLGRTDIPAVNRGEAAGSETENGPPGASAPAEGGAVAAEWQHGEPVNEGWYACLGTWADIPERTIAYWRDGFWYEEKNSRRAMTDTKIHSFYPLPEV